jgi:hypothetical protein
MLVPSQEKQTIALLLVTSVFFLSVPVGAACVVVYKCFCSMYYVIAYGTMLLNYKVYCPAMSAVICFQKTHCRSRSFFCAFRLMVLPARLKLTVVNEPEPGPESCLR